MMFIKQYIICCSSHNTIRFVFGVGGICVENSKLISVYLGRAELGEHFKGTVYYSIYLSKRELYLYQLRFDLEAYFSEDHIYKNCELIMRALYYLFFYHQVDLLLYRTVDLLLYRTVDFLLYRTVNGIHLSDNRRLKNKIHQKTNHLHNKLVNLAHSSKIECMVGAKVDRGDVCFDNGRCEDGKCKNLCQFYGKVPCLCEADNIVSVYQSFVALQ
jgi:hypothetical protein